jgi:hypothetical protein
VDLSKQKLSNLELAEKARRIAARPNARITVIVPSALDGSETSFPLRALLLGPTSTPSSAITR